MTSIIICYRTSVAIYGENIIWATCAGELLLRNHEDELIDRIKVHSSQIWWIEVSFKIVSL
jgi:hypothetical protein